MNITVKISAALAAGLLLSACAGRPVKFADAPDLSQVDTNRGRKITAQAGGFMLFSALPLGTNDRQYRAYEELLTEAGTDKIANIAVKETWSYGFVGTSYWTILTATAYPPKSRK
ncbi:hypothetical protein ACW73L_19040 [Methylolobus aquaticus]